jgi:preprotein translocase subunit SecE
MAIIWPKKKKTLPMTLLEIIVSFITTHIGFYNWLIK